MVFYKDFCVLVVWWLLVKFIFERFKISVLGVYVEIFLEEYYEGEIVNWKCLVVSEIRVWVELEFVEEFRYRF